jgi:predicted RNase H-like HicB family nuclease
MSGHPKPWLNHRLACEETRLHHDFMKIHAIVHKAEEGGFWAEVPSIPGCATQGETMDELRSNLREAIEGCLSVPVETSSVQTDDQVIELAL